MAAVSMMIGIFRPGLMGICRYGTCTPEYFGRDILGPDPVVDLVGIPFLELHDELDLLAVPDGADAEQMRHIDDSQPPDLHVVTDDLACSGSQEDVPAHAADLHRIVRHEPVAPLDQLEGRLALADAAVSHDQDADPEHLDQNTPCIVCCGAKMFESARSSRAEKSELVQVRLEDRTARTPRRIPRSSWCGCRLWVKMHAGDLVAEELADRLGLSFLVQLVQVGVFSPAEELDPLEGEIVVETRSARGPAGSGPARRCPGSGPDGRRCIEIQGVVFLQVEIQQVEYGKLFHVPVLSAFV